MIEDDTSQSGEAPADGSETELEARLARLIERFWTSPPAPDASKAVDDVETGPRSLELPS